MFKFLKVASTVSLCGALMMVAPASEAALVGYTFSGVADSGSLLDTSYTGSFSYDDAGLINSDYEYIDLSSFAFTFGSAAYTLADADITANLPSADFLDGEFLGVSYMVSSSLDPTFSLISASEYGDVAYFSYTAISGDSGFGSLSYVADVSAVPVPAAVWLFTSALAGFGVITRRKRIA